MKSGVTSSLSPNQNGSTSLRPRPALATSRIFEPGSSAITCLIVGSSGVGRALHGATRREFSLGRGQVAHGAKPVARSLIVVRDAGFALAPHHADVQGLDDLLVGCTHRAFVNAPD